MNVVRLNSAQLLSAWGGLDPLRNPRNVTQRSEGIGINRIDGDMIDDSTISPDNPRDRVPPLRFSAVVPENATLLDIQLAVSSAR
jgi:hypothetical protein